MALGTDNRPLRAVQYAQDGGTSTSGDAKKAFNPIRNPIAVSTGGTVGPKGDKGDTGPQGPPGPTGPVGSSTGWFSVADRGADPTGAADSTAAFNATIAIMPADRAVLFLPPGKYRLTAAINLANKTHWVIYGPGAQWFLDYTGYPSGNVNTLTIAPSCSDMEIDGIHFNANATARDGGSIHLRIGASHTKVRNCTIENGGGFGLYFGDSLTTWGYDFQCINTLFYNTWADGAHVSPWCDGVIFDNCIFDKTGDDCIGVTGYEGGSNKPRNIGIYDCIFKNMDNHGGGSGCAIRLNMVDNVIVDGCEAYNFPGTAFRVSDAGTGQVGIYSTNIRFSNLLISNCPIGIEAYFFDDMTVDGVEFIGVGNQAVHLSDWRYSCSLKNIHAYGYNQPAFLVYMGGNATTSFAGRPFTTNRWGDLEISNCSIWSNNDYALNVILYMDIYTALFTMGRLLVQGCTGLAANSTSYWLLYQNLSGGQVNNCTMIGSNLALGTSGTLNNSGGVSVTCHNVY